MNRAGFTLIELLIVMSLALILMTASTMQFNKMVKKSQIESKTREIFNDFNEARLNSIYLKRPHSLVFQPNSYVMKRFSSNNESTVTGGTVIATKYTNYQITQVGGASIANYIFVFDTRGFTTNLLTIYLNPVKSGAMFDCIVINDARTNMGQGVDSDNDGNPNSCNAQ